MRRLLPLLAVLVAGCADVEIDVRSGEDGDATETRVTRIVDGDTLVVTGDERVRLIGVDTPETRKPGTPVQCFGKKATAFTKAFVLGRGVRLVRDVEDRDRYGRLLAYVERVSDGASLNAALVREGYAVPLTVPPNVARADQYARLAREAREAGRGLWSACR